MMKKLYLLAAAFAAVFSGSPAMAQEVSDPVQENATLQLVSRQFAFTEGPAMNKKGEIFFTDQPNNTIWKFGLDGKLTLFMKNAGRSNGLFFHPDGSLIACADEKNELWSVTPAGKVKVLLGNYEGRLFNGPNDVWVDKNGGIWFTDPYYQRDYWSRKAPELLHQGLYFLAPGSAAAVLVDTAFRKLNGLVGTPDGKTLYVTDLGGGKTYRYTIDGPGKLSGRTLFAEKGCDGMTLDSQGNVYLSGNGVTIYNSEGRELRHIKVPEEWTANLCFGGKDKDILFVTAKQAVYTIRMLVKAAE
ncbi:SMP-30/gluconolactonase/LRE family protein [Pedobacter sp. SYP-B3415]|uniref:SMP-30/gluconolactonase/LRE family protein n=1 Tax=Pedobacter sp. SYP-B3415 TaxID=2496641 RepID=UPI001F113AAE|nr:SMP-30/gluconolactonase/LRE family protein [Pedobacter sp. SYP-B3415]